ncbi:hypothetical protein [Planomicrobium okeanokoites]|uniref:Uncharacterized protein n=1 Tax=Planomicrobium okeanokoites TaxID=244 RepID=A0ABV7KL48_PLAOK|nr:hypothetical protein [Planomicrobium okeanokoites]TAA69418.1 hypothetical protein D2910_08760 [Planomicrobium okeanokoites]
MAIKPASPATPDAPASGVVFSIGAVSFALAFEDDYSILGVLNYLPSSQLSKQQMNMETGAAAGELYMPLAIFAFFLHIKRLTDYK